ncbi:MAG TPA: di-heme oxidoredictase family protein [Candidatus Angelobacter sp.]|nr:di-heme oxidoredictase family protein [Candidatus Angelobacter sp.]
MMSRKIAVSMVFLALFFFAAMASAQVDPGVRSCNSCAGGPLPSVAANNPAGILTSFNDARNVFNTTVSVSGTIEPGSGLGPRFNSRNCAFCHAQPAIGGTGAASNPEVVDANADGATNTIPSFITANGPTREARFPFFFDAAGNVDTSAPNGGVEDLFTITGRSDAGSCNLAQPSFDAAVAAGNIIFRIPTPVFGAGLVENIDESTLLTNAANNSGAFGTSGTFNHNGNDGTISKFGWKAQNKSMLIFAGEATNAEMGVSNEMFTQERPLPGEDQLGTGLPANCRINPTPEDHTGFSTDASSNLSRIIKFALFMRLTAPPTPSTTVPGGAASISNGNALFNSIGCAACHTPTLRTTASSITASLSNAEIHPFSDFEIHHMGTRLNDNVSQGGAGGDQFRSSPLWGVGQRIFFLHDGRTTDLLRAIRQHASNGSEANSVIANFNSLTTSQQQDLLNFLRSL